MANFNGCEPISEDWQGDSVNMPKRNFVYCGEKNHNPHARNHAAMNVPSEQVKDAVLMK